jgi:hypothetical protein
VVLGGLLTAVVLDMLVVPVLYRRYGVQGLAGAAPDEGEAQAVRPPDTSREENV